MPKISIVVPLYNKENSIGSTIQSVLSQSFTDFDLVVVDDGSTDGSAAVVGEFHDGRIRLVWQENSGPAAARNKGVDHAQGEWLIFLDADDEFLPDALQIYAQLVEEHPDADIIDCGQILKSNGSMWQMCHTLEGYSRNPVRDWYYGRIGPGANHSVFSRKYIKKYPYNTQLRRFEDADLLIRMLKTARVYSSTIPTSLVHCDYSSASMKRDNIVEDYVGHLSFVGVDFWTKMCIYRLYLENRVLYPEEMRRLYPTWSYRYDLLLLYKLLNIFR